MDKHLIHKHSSVAGKTIGLDKIEFGEIAVNYAVDQENITIKNSGNKLVKFLTEKQVNDTFVNVTGDTMSGNLNVEANVSIGTGNTFNGTNADGNSQTGEYAFAQGISCTASGPSSHAEGYFTEASGEYSHAEGSDTQANGFGSHAEGNYTQAIGDYSHAEGVSTIASGNYSHAEGSDTQAIGNWSHAEGRYTIANNRAEHSNGIYNVSISGTSQDITALTVDTQATLFSIGNGVDENNRKNAFEIKYNGDTYIPEGNVSIGKNNSFTFTDPDTQATKIGTNSFAQGANCIVSGYRSHAEGGSTKANGEFCHAEGVGTISKNYASHSEGSETQANGNASHSEGSGTTANGLASHAEGKGTIANNLGEHSNGTFNVSISGTSQELTALTADTQATLFSIGNGDGNNKRRNAFEVKYNGDAYFSGNTKFDKTVNVKGDTTINSKLKVDGTTSLQATTATTINATSITVPTINATTITATTGNITNVNSTTVTAVTGNITTVNSTTVTSPNVNSVTLTAKTIDATTVTAPNINSVTITATTGNITNVNATTVTAATGNITTVNSTNVNATTITAATGNITTVNATTGNITNVIATDITTDTLDVASGTIDTLTSTTITVPTIKSTNISATTVTAPNLVGNSSTATKLQTARTIALSGDVTGTTSFDGSGNVTIASVITPLYAASPSKGGPATSANKVNSTLSFASGTFAAKTFNGSAAVTVNVPTATSHLSNNSDFATNASVDTKITAAESKEIHLTGVTGSANGTMTFAKNQGTALTFDSTHTHPTSEVTGLDTKITTITNSINSINTTLGNGVVLKKVSDLKYNLLVDNVEKGVIDIPKDQFLNKASYDTTTNELVFNFTTSGGATETRIGVGHLIDTYTAGNGLLLADNKFSIDTSVTATKDYVNTGLNGKSDNSHGHVIGDVSGLQTALDGKQASGSYASSSHNHSGTYANASHTHTIANVTNLQTTLDGKSGTGHTHNYAAASHSHSDYASTSHSHSQYVLKAGDTMTGSLTVQGTISATSQVYSSDISLKENIEVIKDTDIEAVRTITPKAYAFKEDMEHRVRYGTIAQEVEQTSLSELVYEDEMGIKGVDYISYLIIKCEQLQRDLNSLQNKFDELSK